MTRLAFVILAACAPAVPAMKSPPSRPREVKLADLGDARPFRNYVAVTDVDHAGEHFTVWYRDIEPTVVRVNVWRDADGKLVLAEESGYWGGLGVAPDHVGPLPREVEPLARDVEAELERRNPDARDWKIAYGGNFRSVAVDELIAHDFKGGTQRFGWTAHVTFAMDASLSHIIKSVESRSGFGLIEVPKNAQWVELAKPGNGRALLVTAPTPELGEKIGEAARRFDANEASPALASLVPAGEPMLPEGYVAQVAARVSIYGRITNGNGFGLNFVVPLGLPDAVFGAGASGEASQAAGDRRYTVRATLTPASPRTPSPERASDRYTGTLSVRVDDGKGHTWEHAYPATGRLELEGNQVVAPVGFDLPGASAPSKEADALHGDLPGFGKITSVDVYVAVGVYAEPAR